MKSTRVLPAACCLLFLCSGCMAVNADREGGENVSAVAQKIMLSGSTSMEDLMNALGAGFEKENTGFRVEVQSGGSSVGIANVKDHISDIGDSSRALKRAKRDMGLPKQSLQSTA